MAKRKKSKSLTTKVQVICNTYTSDKFIPIGSIGKIVSRKGNWVEVKFPRYTSTYLYEDSDLALA